MIFAESEGLFNNVRDFFGMEPLLVMQKESWFRPIYVLSTIWKESGWGTVVYLAAISSIDPSRMNRQRSMARQGSRNRVILRFRF